ncbi:hypothetical protein ACK8P5_26220 (plasmid) [Paenibacillus sp. EC2-1]|uniref:hypothetical protein n=1 Tax=Paenibacillus sp. EC2-1 TaxID=3388665 RepID=UPI003BEEC6BD
MAELPKVSDKLPDEIASRKIMATSSLTEKSWRISARDIDGTSICHYVNDIHDQNPIIMTSIYWLRLKNNPYVIVRVTEEDYNWVLDTMKIPAANHLANIVDCSINPTLSYGFRLHELNGHRLPTLDLIKRYEDEILKGNPTMLHNSKMVIKIAEKENPTKTEDLADDTNEEVFFFDDNEEVELDEGEEWVS